MILIPVFNTCVLPGEILKLELSVDFVNLLKNVKEVIVIPFLNISNLQELLFSNQDVITNKYGVKCKFKIININALYCIVRLTATERVVINSFNYCEDSYFTCKWTLYPIELKSDKFKEFEFIKSKICDYLYMQDKEMNIYDFTYLPPPSFFYKIGGYLNDKHIRKIFLESNDILKTLKHFLYNFLDKGMQNIIEEEINTLVKENIEKQHKYYILQEKLKVLQEEIKKNSKYTEEEEFDIMIENNVNIPSSIKQVLMKEYYKMKTLPLASNEYSISYNYLKTILSLPWGKYTNMNDVDLQGGENILDKHHYGLKEVKEKILNYLATLIKNKNTNNKILPKILLFLGPPGVGKTSICKSIAECLQRKFHFISLTSVSDSSDLVGHRRTFVGSLPGMIVDALLKTGVSNPLIQMDELDKINRNAYNDPLKVITALIDETQNNNFTDNYLNIPYDISNVMFVFTANTIENIPFYILSRMEIIYVDGYSIEEKKHIVKNFLLPDIYKQLGIDKNEIQLEDNFIEYLIKFHTRELGVRSLSKKIKSILEKAVFLLLKEKKKCIKITKKNVKTFINEVARDFTLKPLSIGNSIGLSWSQVGGDTLIIESAFIPANKSSFEITGNLGNVMKESATVAYSLIRQNAHLYSIENDFFENHILHLHAPEGAIPKNGPSAGISIYFSILSALLKKTLKVIAMTGEINLNGQITAIGGIKEKLLGAINYGIQEVILPLENKEDYNLIIDKDKSLLDINVHFVQNIQEAEKILLV